jgi:predicted DCC family thiol-disulfide oxidoreductase YuxK
MSNAAPASVQEQTGRARPVLFFDGVCGLCNRAVDFVLARDREGVFLFAPLQGETAQRLLSARDVQSLDTLVLLTPRGAYRRSAAVVRILWELPLLWQATGWLLWVVPLPLRDLAYRVVASNRYRLFGRKETCRLATADERERFLP